MKIPAADPGYLDVVVPEVTVPSGEETQVCLYYTHDGPDVAVVGLDGIQSEFGHHVVVLKPKTPKPSGTVEDCSSGTSMGEFNTFVLPVSELPAKHAIRMVSGMNVVIQAHTLNVGDRDILVRDVARLKLMPVDQVEQWATTFATGSIDFSLPPKQTTAVEFDCTVSEDMDLLFVGGHMHYLGSRFQLSWGADAASLQPFYLADPWLPDYRDIPPVTLLFNNPMKLTKGTVIRTLCEWKNPEATVVQFPQEMCGSFGYVRGATDAFNCEATSK